MKNNYNKKEKIIEEVKTYESDDLKCVYPVADDSTIICKNEDDEYLSYNYVKENILDFSKLNNINFEVKKVEKKLGDISVDVSKLDLNSNIFIWKYNGFYQVSNDNLSILNDFTNDKYKNDLGVLAGKYYFVPNYDQEYDYTKFYVYNLENNSRKEIDIDFKINYDSYINGVYNNDVYLFDKDSLKQYRFDLKKRKVFLVGDKDTEGVIFDGVNFVKKSVYDLKNGQYFSKEKRLFNYEIINKKLFLISEVNDIKILIKDNFDSKDLYLVNDDVYFIEDEYLYRYSFNKEIYNVLSYNEFLFNDENRIAIFSD